MQNLAQTIDLYAGVIIIGLISYFILIMIMAALRHVLWWFSSLFFLIDEFMWFLYNPLRSLMKVDKKVHQRSIYRKAYVLLTYTLIAPLYKLTIYFVTTPLRVITAIYYDVLMYLLVSTMDTIDELFKPSLRKMRHRKGFSYFWRWIVFFPYRLCWFVFKNIFSVLDSICMMLVSIAFPTFTMYHGSSKEALSDVSQQGRWLVGSGNYGGSGIYFGRSIKIALHYVGSGYHHDKEGGKRHPLIISRVTLTMLRNVATLPQKTRAKYGSMGDEGIKMAQEIKFPFFATELWRKDKKWWEYCILRGHEPGQLVKTWRVRPVGLVFEEKGAYSGALQRLWGGKSHYSLSITNIGVSILSAGICAILIPAYFQFQTLGGISFLAGVFSGIVQMIAG